MSCEYAPCRECGESGCHGDKDGPLCLNCFIHICRIKCTKRGFHVTEGWTYDRTPEGDAMLDLVKLTCECGVSVVAKFGKATDTAVDLPSQWALVGQFHADTILYAPIPKEVFRRR